jgi:AAA+ superfamily predicted ATPase
MSEQTSDPPAPTGPDDPWLQANQAHLIARLAELRVLLARHVGRELTTQPPPAPDPAAFVNRPPALTRLTAMFGLSSFEANLLLLCAGMELDAALPALCAAAQGDPAKPYPTFSLALAALPGAHWSALAPDAPLRHWRLIEPGNGGILTQAPLRIDERVLHELVGIHQLDARLAVLIDPVPPVSSDDLVPSQAEIARQAATLWLRAPRGRDLSVIQLCGSLADCRPVAAATAHLLGLQAALLPAERLPDNATELDSLLRLWEREAALSGLGVLIVDCDDSVPTESETARGRVTAVSLLLERAEGPVILREREPRRVQVRPATVLDVPHPTGAEQIALWRAELGETDKAVEEAASQFSLSAATIRALAAELRAAAASPPPTAAGAMVWDLCRRRLRSALDGLAQRIVSDLNWDDLVLPPEQKQTLHAIAAQLRQRATVYDRWGFAAKSRRGLGISALFHGPSGTGKTMAAEVLASELRLDLYHIDLSRIVSKYIGETEANLRRVFDAAEENGAILLFDEADSLFGTRSQVKDSHDRYANIEVSYLLQRMEAYRGLAVLTTNLRSALDQAFLRRIRFAVQFPFPDEKQRAAIWRQVFPAAAETHGLAPDRLAHLRLAGGNIRTIALNAAFLAADAGEPVQMHHLRIAAQAEYTKLDRRLTQAEAEAWA